MAPLVSVGALNPNGTVALFSNIGPWVQTFATGAAVLSTVPAGTAPTAFSGGLHATAAAPIDGLNRETIDPDDFTGGFAVWSGTSFAAPVIAGRIAAELHRSPGDRSVERARRAVESVLTQPRRHPD